MATFIPLSKAAGFFVANVSLGNPPQEMHLMLDTGSAAMWVAESTCLTPGQQPCPAEKLFERSGSKTAEVVGDAKPIVYMDKSKIEGKLLHDTVWLGGVPFESTEVLIATKVSGTIVGSGVLGLEYGTQDPSGDKEKGNSDTKGLLDSAMPKGDQLESIQVIVGEQGQSPQIVLTKDPTMLYDWSSNIKFSTDAFTSGANTNPKWYASLRALGLSTGSGDDARVSWNIDFNRFASLGAPALLDSGAGAIRLGSIVYENLIASLPDCKKDSTGLHCACGIKERDSWGGAIFPSLSLSFESYENSRFMGIDSGKDFLVCIPPENYVVQLPDSRCKLALVDGGPNHMVFGHEAVVLGMPVLQSVDFAYEAKRKLTGFAASPSGSCANPRDSWVSTHVTPWNILVLFLSIAAFVLAVQNLQACARVRKFFGLFSSLIGSRRSGRTLGGDNEMHMVNPDAYREQRMSRLQAAQNTPTDHVFVAMPEE